MFFKKKINSDEYERISKQVIDLKADIAEIKTNLINLEQQIRSLRGTVNKRIYKDDPNDQTKDLYNGMLLPYDGSFK